uniref:Uncharacterized protein n=1 Tax=Cajanus cajan TaxID=3821 RepID=A0A151UD19_CAJCA|nr:hypothetical protein KK1_021402 [Cajanus cajan]
MNIVHTTESKYQCSISSSIPFHALPFHLVEKLNCSMDSPMFTHTINQCIESDNIWLHSFLVHTTKQLLCSIDVSSFTKPINQAIIRNRVGSTFISRFHLFQQTQTTFFPPSLTKSINQSVKQHNIRLNTNSHSIKHL